MRNKNSDLILQRRYARKDEDFNSLEPSAEGIFRRVAKAVASVEEESNRKMWEDRFYDLMNSCDFLPNSPTLMNAGTNIGLLSACFVVPVGDSMEEIFSALYNGAMIQRYGGGVGYSFSDLRPEGSFTSKTQGKASGPVSFMGVFDAMCATIKQGGKRRGAQIALLRIDHPDILKFIGAKADNKSLTNFNISVSMTNEFMDNLIYYRENGIDYDFALRDPRDNSFITSVSIIELWNKIVHTAWETGDPGLLFIDKVNEQRPFPFIPIEGCNPCGELPLEDFGSCNLGSINLGNFVGFSIKEKIKWNDLSKVVGYAVRFLDNVIDLNKYPEQLVVKNGKPLLKNPIEEMSKYSRRIGLGIMGWADMLAKLKIPYDSEEAVQLAEKVMSFIHKKALNISVDLAKERGPFPGFYESIYKDLTPMRNATVTTIAPTGTVSRIAGCSSGIEPYFALNYYSEVMDGDILEDIPEPFVEFLNEGIGIREEDINLRDKECILEFVRKGTTREYCKNLDISSGVYNNKWWTQLEQVFKTSNEINWSWHIKHQAAFQKYVDNSIAKTINMPNDATKEDVSRAYIEAYKQGCKGITIYRDRSKSKQVLNRFSNGPDISLDLNFSSPNLVSTTHNTTDISGIVAQERPVELVGKTTRVRTGHGNAYVTVNAKNDIPFEVFVALGKAGGCDSAYIQAISRLATLCLRSGIAVSEVVDNLIGISCHPIWDNGNQIQSVPDALAQVLSRSIEAVDELSNEVIKVDSKFHSLQEAMDNLVSCPECEHFLIMQGGCKLCPNCAWSNCG